MAKAFGYLRRLNPTRQLIPKSRPSRQTRCLSAATRYQTDGVYQELTAMRTRTPFIEAFKLQQANKLAKPISADSVERDLSPKSMADSYHKVVCHMIVS